MPDVVSPPETKVASNAKANASAQGLKRKRRPVKPKPNLAPVAAAAPYASAFAIGDRVSHPQFGEGAVTEIDDAKLTINFASRGTKQIIDDFVKRSKEGRAASSESQSDHPVGQQH